MNTLVKSVVAAGAMLALTGGDLVFAAPADPIAAKRLGHEISTAAATAERSAVTGEIAVAVRGAVQNVIIRSAEEPIVVLSALDNVLTACRVTGRGQFPEYYCPATVEAFSAVAALRGIVVAQLEQTDPAALDTPGTAAFGSVPSTSAGIANYRTF